MLALKNKIVVVLFACATGCVNTRQANIENTKTSADIQKRFWKVNARTSQVSVKVAGAPFPDTVNLHKQMSFTDISRLSPEDKLALWTGKPPLNLNQVYFKNGVYVASLNEKEPQKDVIVNNENGQSILFYIDDVKILAAKLYDGFADRHVQEFTSASDFHRLILSKTQNKEVFFVEFEKKGTPFTIPLVSYDMELPAPEPVAAGGSLFHTPGTAFTSNVKIRMSYENEGHQFAYILDLDKDKNILGGRWTSELHPRKFWLPSNNPKELEKEPFYKEIKMLLTKASI